MSANAAGSAAPRSIVIFSKGTSPGRLIARAEARIRTQPAAMSHLVMGKFYIKGIDTAVNRPYTEDNSRFSGVFMRNLFLCAALAVSAAAQPRVAIDEPHIRAIQRDGHTVVILPIENQLNR